jgi:hypothetical protein
MSDCENIQNIKNKEDTFFNLKPIKDLKSKDDIGGMIINASYSIQWKKIILLWLLFIVMNTEIFMDKCISKFDGSVENGMMTMKGTFLMSILLVMVYIFIDLLYG